MVAKGNKVVHLSMEEIDYIKRNASTMSCVQIARWIGCCPSTVTYHRNKYKLGSMNISWTKENTERLMLYLKDGYTCKQIASLFGSTIENIYVAVNKFRRLGIIKGHSWKGRRKSQS